MAPDQAAPVPAGWYPDPYAVSELRWWDGQNWTDSVHPPVVAPPAAPPAVPEPVAPEPVVAEPVAPEPVVAEPVAPEPVVAEPVAPEPVVAEPVVAPSAAPPAAPEPVFAAPVVAEPVVAEPAAPLESVAPPEVVTPAEPAPLIEPTPGDGLPSRRQLRARTASATGDGSGPAGASGGTVDAPPPAPVPDSSEPSSFNWLPGGAALGTGASVSAATTSGAAEPADPVLSPPAPSAAVPAPQASSPSAQPVADAWTQEPAVATDDLYSTAATRTSTVSGWFIALMPLFAGILSIAVVKGAENYPRYIPATFEWWMLAGGVVVALYLVTILLAVADRSKLDWAGYTRPAHWAWSLLSAPVYLLVRTIAARRETGRNSALLWVWLVLAAALVGAWFALNFFMPDLLAAYPLPFL